MVVVQVLLGNHADPSKIHLVIGDGEVGRTVIQSSQTIKEAALEQQNEVEQAQTSTAATLITPSTTDGPSKRTVSKTDSERKLFIGIVIMIHTRMVVKVTDISSARRSRMARRRLLTP